MKRLNVRGTQLDVLVRGSGRPLLFVHAFPLDHSMWGAQIERFASQALVIAPDLRGFGTSAVTTGTVTMEQLADDLAAVLDALGVTEPVVLCGLSMGGYVAFQFVRKYSQRLRGLVLCNTRATSDTPDVRRARMEMTEQVLTIGPVAAADAMVPRCFTAESCRRLPGVVEFVRERILLTPAEAIVAALRGLAERPDATGLLEQLPAATLVIAGEDDAITPVGEMREMAAKIPGCEFVTIAGAGHLTAVEAPVEFNSVLARFLAQRAGPPAPAR